MMAAVQQMQLVFFHGVDEAVLLVDSPAPKARKLVFERFGFADALKMFTHDCFYKFIDAAQHFFIVHVSVEVVILGVGKKNEFHSL